jgi:divalent metal cation (Fe/Co/Zn/Cd) transporter
MVSSLQILPASDLRRIHRIQAITILWMCIEVAVGMWAAWRAHSPAMFAFSGDSAIELFSACVVLWRFRSPDVGEREEKRAARIAGGLLFVLAAYVLAVSVLALLGYAQARSTYLGIALLAAAIVVMPWLAREKRRLSSKIGSAALRADAAESALCAYLAMVALVGLALNAFWRLGWADPVAAIAITPLIAWEGRKAIRGQACGCY